MKIKPFTFHHFNRAQSDMVKCWCNACLCIWL